MKWVSLKYYKVDDYGKIIIPKYEDLPILEHKNEILTALEDTQVLIITGETGSGKSTQVPQYILGNDLHYLFIKDSSRTWNINHRVRRND